MAGETGSQSTVQEQWSCERITPHIVARVQCGYVDQIAGVFINSCVLQHRAVTSQNLLHIFKTNVKLDVRVGSSDHRLVIFSSVGVYY